MMLRRVASLCSSLVALVVLLVGVVGVPWLLVRWGRVPFTGSSSIGNASGLVTHVVSDAALFEVLTLLAWAAWLVFTACVVVELTAALRGVATPRLLGIGVVQVSAARLVAALLLSFAAARPAGASTLAPHGAPRGPEVHAITTTRDVIGAPRSETTPVVPARSGIKARSAPGPVQPVETPATASVVAVGPGDSAWAIAEQYLGDGMRWRELWDLNRDRPQPDGAKWTDPELLLPGWQLRLPASQPGGVAADGSAAVGAAHGGHLYMVVPGDDLSGIAARELGDPALAGALFDANQGLRQADGDALSDPNLIRPGWILTLPDRAPTADASSPTIPEPNNGGGSGTAPTPPSTWPDHASSVAPGSPATSLPEPSSTPAATTPRDAPGAAPHAAGQEVRVVDASDAGEDGGLLPARAPELAGIAGATILATGLALWLGRLRRRHAARGARHLVRRHRDARRARHVDEVAGEAVRAVFAAADLPLARWAGHMLASLVDSRSDGDTVPVLVELSAEGGLEVLWDAPRVDPSQPWEVRDHGWAWRVPFDPEAPLPHAPADAVVPGLVTIGRRDERQLLVDLEAFGTLAVVGDPVRVDEFLRSVVLELATGEELSDAYVATVDVPCDATEYGGRVIPAAMAGALARLAAAATTADELLEQHSLPSTFAYRTTGSDRMPLETTVVVARVHDATTTESLCAVARPGRSVAAIVAGDGVAGERKAARLVLAADGTGCLEPLGVRFVAVGLPDETARSLVDVLATEAAIAHDLEYKDFLELSAEAVPSHVDPSSSDLERGPSTAAATSTGSDIGGRGALDTSADDVASREDACDVDGGGLLVRVFGVPSVPERPTLGRRELQLTVFLALRDRPASTASVQDALWNGQAMSTKTMWNLVARTRAKLGTFADGQPVFPPADRLQGTVQLASGVRTDLAVLRGCYERALQVSSGDAIDALSSGLDLVDGPPFDAPGYDWAHHGEQWVADASMLIEQATVLLVELRLAAGDVDGARVAVTRGLRGLPGNEVLYRWRMRIERDAGNLAAVRAAYRELRSFLDDLDVEPSLATCALYEELVGSGLRARV